MCLPIIVGESRNSLAAAAKEPRSATFTKTDMLVSRSMIINQWCFYNARFARLWPDSNDLGWRDQRNAWEWQVQFDFKEMSPPERYRLLLATVLPRPIAWITTRDPSGAINAAPFSFFNVFGSDPATVGVGIGSKGPGEPKDTRANIRANEQFVVNLVPFALAQEMRVTSIAFPRGVEEAKEAGLSLAPSERVGVPRIAQAPVSMECTLMQEVLLGGFSLVLGRILLVHVHDEAVMDRGRQHIDAGKLDLIGRMEGAWYTKTTDRFEMPPIALDDWKVRTAIDAG
jgi:flavin reductase (DIM6/NTAB) family NADH-FMN oxidoreductase RutF